MGVWALPQTAKQAKELQKLVSKPLTADIATNQIYHLLGDDDLFDRILEEKETCGDDYDVRILVKSSLSKFLDQKENALKAWNQKAYQICQNICKS